MGGKRPDITLAQVLAVFGWVVAQLLAFGVVDGQREQLLISGGSTVIAAVWKLADAWLRVGRNKAPTAP